MSEVPVETHTQETKWSCGPAALKMLLEHQGHVIEEDQLVELSDAGPDGGTEHEGLVSAAKVLGYEVFAKEDASVTDLVHFVEKGLPVLIDFQGKKGGHFAVVVSTDGGRIHIVDPRRKGSDRYSLDPVVFAKRWFNIRYDDKRRVNRWMMVISR
jgi:ABC-type bacteriocin/lantibiotic exporter with double-glycine peptidase domain